MRYSACLLALLMTVSLPSHARAATHLASHSRSQKLACGIRVSGDEVSKYHHLLCVVGIAVKVSPRGIQVRAKKGWVRSFSFADETQFETDSGEGALNGLVARDHVCVAYTARARSLTARIVAFDPLSNPCSPGKRLRPVDGGSNNSGSEQA